MVQLIYGPNEVQPSLKAICNALKSYVDTIPTEATRDLARRSVASLVTNSAGNTQCGTTLFDTAAAAVPEAQAAIKAWADWLVDKCLNPRSVSFLDTQLDVNGTQPDTSANPHVRDGSQLRTLAGEDQLRTLAGNQLRTLAGEDQLRTLAGDQLRTLAGEDQLRTLAGDQLRTLAGTRSDGSTHPDTGDRDLAQARHNSVLTCTSDTPRGYGHEPPTKQPRLSTDTGFNALSTFKKCQILTYSRVATANFIRSHLKNLLEVDKADRFAWFNVNLMPLLIDKDPEAFIGFSYTGDFIEQLCDVQLTSESADTHWESFTGHQLRRNKEEVQQLNRIYKSRYNPQLQLQVSPSQLSTLNSKAPVPITTKSELNAYIKRDWHCSALFFPSTAICSLAR
jgi:hypothetical protein